MEGGLRDLATAVEGVGRVMREVLWYLARGGLREGQGLRLGVGLRLGLCLG